MTLLGRRRADRHTGATGEFRRGFIAQQDRAQIFVQWVRNPAVAGSAMGIAQFSFQRTVHAHGGGVRRAALKAHWGERPWPRRD